MKKRQQIWVLTVLFASCLLLGGCGEDAVPPTDGGGPDGGGGGPIEVFDIFLRPYIVQRAPSLAGGLPNPQQSLYYLTAFYRGGQPTSSFDWEFDPRLGSIVPKTMDLTPTSATVSVLNDGQTPLGIYEIAVTATSGSTTSTLRKHFAVAELNWMKHERATITNPSDVPPDLELSPVFVPQTAGGDLIYFVGSPSRQAVGLWAIRADASLQAGPQTPEMSLYFVTTCDVDSCPWGSVNSLQALTAEERDPSPSPQNMGRDELLFTSQMDPQWSERQSARNNEKLPYNLWVVKRPSTLGIPFRAKVLTFDATFDSLGGQYFRAYIHRQPQWDPTAVAGPGQAARIAFISNRGPDSLVAYGTNLWLADLQDFDANGASDSLTNMRPITTVGGISNFDWSPDGQFIYFLRSGKDLIYRLNVASRAVEEISLADKDSELKDFRWLSVFRGNGNLITFQGTSENRVYLLVYDLAADELIRVTPYEFAVGRNLFPRWHPSRLEIVFVCDYTVGRWLPEGDVYPIGNPEFGGLNRTLYPSVWTIRLQER